MGRRKTNQDRIAYCYSRDALLMLVADGMGGHLHGEVAAHLATQFITQTFQREAQPVLHNPARFLSRTLNNAHHAIADYALDRNLPEVPRTTIVACIVQEGAARWAHAGDSRLYLLRNGQTVTQTRDHSRVQMMIEQGLLDAESAARHPGRNRIYSCLGGDHPPQIEISRQIKLHDRDTLVLCSDGLWGPLGGDAIALGFSAAPVEEAVPLLLTQAEKIAGPTCDNLSVVAMCWHKEDPDAGSVSTQTMALNDFSTQMDTLQERIRGTLAEIEITEDEIEKTIAEINATIHKFSRDPT